MPETFFIDRLGQKHSKPDGVDPEKRISVYGIVIRDGEILLIQSRDFDDWEIPGGGVEAGETHEQALRREFLEETGYKIKKIGRVLQASENNFFSLVRKTFNVSYCSHYVVEVDDSEQFKDQITDETTGVAWFDLESLEIENLNFLSRDLVAGLKKAALSVSEYT